MYTIDKMISGVDAELDKLIAAYAANPDVADWPQGPLQADARAALVTKLQGTLLQTRDGRVHAILFGGVLRVTDSTVKIYVKDLTESQVQLRDAAWFASTVVAQVAGCLSESLTDGRVGRGAAELSHGDEAVRLVVEPGSTGSLSLLVGASGPRSMAVDEALQQVGAGWQDYDHFAPLDGVE